MVLCKYRHVLFAFLPENVKLLALARLNFPMCYLTANHYNFEQHRKITVRIKVML